MRDEQLSVHQRRDAHPRRPGPILAGGTEAACTRSGLGGLSRRALLPQRRPDRRVPPVDKGRDGFVGEGAGVLVMESLAHAKKRGATILGEYLGAHPTDAYDLTALRADGRDVILCMRSALADAGLEADAVDLVNAHGTSAVGDLCEVAAINAVFGSIDKSRFRLNSTKSMLGHSLGAAGAQAVACLQSIATGRVHPTINHDDPEDGVDFDVVANEAQDFRVAVNSFGFGGQLVGAVRRVRGLMRGLRGCCLTSCLYDCSITTRPRRPFDSRREKLTKRSSWSSGVSIPVPLAC